MSSVLGRCLRASSDRWSQHTPRGGRLTRATQTGFALRTCYSIRSARPYLAFRDTLEPSPLRPQVRPSWVASFVEVVGVHQPREVVSRTHHDRADERLVVGHGIRHDGWAPSTGGPSRRTPVTSDKSIDSNSSIRGATAIRSPVGRSTGDHRAANQHLPAVSQDELERAERFGAIECPDFVGGHDEIHSKMVAFGNSRSVTNSKSTACAEPFAACTSMSRLSTGTRIASGVLTGSERPPAKCMINGRKGRHRLGDAESRVPCSPFRFVRCAADHGISPFARKTPSAHACCSGVSGGSGGWSYRTSSAYRPVS